MDKNYQTLEFNIILEQLANLALSEKAKEKLLQLEPSLNERECNRRMRETASALKVMDSLGTPPLVSMPELNLILELAQKGFMLTPEQLLNICAFISACKRMKSYLNRAEFIDDSLYAYRHSFFTLADLDEEINCSIRNGNVDSDATAELRGIRRKMESIQAAIKNKLETILRNNKNWFEDGYVSVRNGRSVLPVKSKYRSQIEGMVIDKSNTGGTFFIEPAAIRKLQDELDFLQIEEDNEVRKILYTLTALVDSKIEELIMNMECMETLDFMFAKAKLALEMKAISVPITTDRHLIIKQGRHPLLDAETCIPLDFEIGGEIKGVVITGPNTGGKTVALKTVGLLSLMAQSGLHVPVGKGSLFCMFSEVLCDIGDGQSISQSLSTFSAHITNVIHILKAVSQESLILLDELGSGTDPAEGMGIAVAILAELKKQNCLFIATTHYPEIKEFASNTHGLINARMEFDRESLKPLYKLQIGEAGESCALYIAKRLGFPDHMLARAEKEAYKIANDSNELATKVNQNGDELEMDNMQPRKTKRTKIQKEVQQEENPSQDKFKIGDSVKIYPENAVGIICKEANEMGEFGVQIKGKKQVVNHKRIKLLVPASELYPEDYDFSIVFDTKENRKARHDMERKYAPDAVITYEDI